MTAPDLGRPSPDPLITVLAPTDPPAAGPVVVVGMHRSATSAVTSLLASAGLDLGPGSTLGGPTRSNVRGHFEQAVVKEAHQQALSRLSATWWSPPGLDAVEAASEDLQPLISECWRGLLQAFTGPPLLKDPLLGLFLQVWRRVLGPEALFVLCVRDPVAVSRSLLSRNQLDPVAAIALWETYNLAALRGLEGARAVVVDVDALRSSPEQRGALVATVLAAVERPLPTSFHDPFEPALLSAASTSTERLEQLTGAQLSLYQELTSIRPDVVAITTSRQLRVPGATARTVARHAQWLRQREEAAARVAAAEQGMAAARASIEKARARQRERAQELAAVRSLSEEQAAQLEAVRDLADQRSQQLQGAEAYAEERTRQVEAAERLLASGQQELEEVQLLAAERDRQARNAEALAEERTLQLADALRLADERDQQTQHAAALAAERELQTQDARRLAAERELQTEDARRLADERALQLADALRLAEERDQQAQHATELAAEREQQAAAAARDVADTQLQLEQTRRQAQHATELAAEREQQAAAAARDVADTQFQLEQTRQQVVDLERLAEERAQRIAEVEQRETQHQQRLEQAERDVARYADQVEQALAMALEAEGTSEDAQEETQRLDEALRSARTALEQQQAATARAQEDLAATRSQLEESRRALATLTADAAASRQAKEEQLALACSERDSVRLQLEDSRRITEVLTADLSAARSAAERAQRAATRATADTAATHALYAAAFQSRSWRWTKFLRGEWPRLRRASPGRRKRAERHRRPADGVPMITSLTSVSATGASVVATTTPRSATPVERARPRVAVVAHLFYPELWQPLREQLGNLDMPFDLFVSLTRGHSDHIAATVVGDHHHAVVRVFDNRGRDVAPFYGFLAEGLLDGYDAVLKIHSKKSHHRVDGDSWRAALWHGLLPNAADAGHFAELVTQHPDVGCVLPAGNLRYEESIGSNLDRMRSLLQRIGVDFDPTELEFPAGSMYWLDGNFVQLLKALNIHPTLDFEPEEGQIDGTTAHALERVVGVLLKRRGQEAVSSEVARNMETAPEWTLRRRPRVLAFYLPQFHRTAENDRWWGEGFTEWTNVEAATSWHPDQRFPRRPVPPLGAYDLTSPEVAPLQAALAKAHGIDGFLVYHYWFSGQRLLDAPMNSLLERPEVDFPYALVWANENWTRAWDGLDDDILVSQDYAAGWTKGLMDSLTPHLRDARYLKVDGRPLVVIFKPGAVPGVVTAISELRDQARLAGHGELHLAGVLHDRHVEGGGPELWSAMDSWIEFPPLSGPEPVEVGVEADGSDSKGTLYSYRQLVDQQHFRALHDGRRIHPAAMPSWDNTPRRRAGASSFTGSNPADFRRWLVALRKGLAATSSPGESLLCINAWNEWAETAYLEPDDQKGYANLEAVASALGLGDGGAPR